MRKQLLIGAALALLAGSAPAADPVRDAELDRVKLVQKVRPAVVSVFMKDFQGDPRGRIAGGGSGVIIDPEGYCLTNYHVVAGPGMSGVTPTFACGLPNGQMYDAVTVGCDRTGDVGLIKLFPKKPGEKFPVAELGTPRGRQGSPRKGVALPAGWLDDTDGTGSQLREDTAEATGG